MEDKGYIYILLNAGRRIWLLALQEIAVIVGLSLAPLLLSIGRDFLAKDPPFSLLGSLQRAYFSGQLVFYAVGLGATVYWLASSDLKGFRPWRNIFQLAVVVILLVAALMIGLDPNAATFNAENVGILSSILFVGAMVLYVLITVITQAKPDVGGTIADEDARLAMAVQQSRGLRQ